MGQNKKVKIKVELSLIIGLLLSLLGIAWGFFWVLYELCVWRKTLFQAFVGSWQNWILLFVCIPLMAIFTVYSEHPEKLCRKKKKKKKPKLSPPKVKDCPQHFGYLHKLKKNVAWPQECWSCLKREDCLKGKLEVKK